MVTRIAVVKYSIMFWMSLLKRSYAQKRNYAQNLLQC